MVHAAGAPQPGVLVVEHRLWRTPLCLCGIPHRAPLAAHGAARPHAADPHDRADREAGEREAAAITSNSFCSDAVGFAVAASAAAA